MAGSRRVFGIVNNGFFVRGWDIRGEKAFGGRDVVGQPHSCKNTKHVQTDEAEQTHD